MLIEYEVPVFMHVRDVRTLAYGTEDGRTIGSV